MLAIKSNKATRVCVCVCGEKEALCGETCGKPCPGVERFMGSRQNMMGLRGQDRTEGED